MHVKYKIHQTVAYSMPWEPLVRSKLLAHAEGAYRHASC